MQQIYLDDLENQKFKVVLNKQNTTIRIYQRGNYIYMDLTLDSTPLLTGAICYDRTLIIQRTIDFAGNFMFIDLIGTTNPEHSNLSSRYVFIYIEDSDV